MRWHEPKEVSIETLSSVCRPLRVSERIFKGYIMHLLPLRTLRWEDDWCNFIKTLATK